MARKELSLDEILKKLDDQLVFFHHPFEYDESTIRKKLNEYIKENLKKWMKY